MHPGVWEIVQQKAKLGALPKDSPEYQLLKHQFNDLIKDYYYPRILKTRLKAFYEGKDLPQPQEQWDAETSFSITKEQLGNLWFGKNGKLNLVHMGDNLYKQMVCSDRGCTLLPVTDKVLTARQLKMKQVSLHESLCEMLDRPNPCAAIEERYIDLYSSCMQRDSLRVFRKLGFFKGVQRHPGDPLSRQPGESSRNRLLRDAEAQRSIQEWLNHFNAAPQEELEALSG